jgi:hypothetical protein
VQLVQDSLPNLNLHPAFTLLGCGRGCGHEDSGWWASYLQIWDLRRARCHRPRSCAVRELRKRGGFPSFSLRQVLYCVVLYCARVLYGAQDPFPSSYFA